MKLLILLSFLLASTLNAAMIDIDSKSYNCPKKEDAYFQCSVNGREVFVKKNGHEYVALSSDQNKIQIYSVSKVIDGMRILFEKKATLDFNFSAIGETDQKSLADLAQIHFSEFKDPALKGLMNTAQSTINRGGLDKQNKLKLQLNGQETYNCSRGQSKDQSAQCEYFECKGMSADEKILAYLPNPMNSFVPPHVLRMNKGQAKLDLQNFKALSQNNFSILTRENLSLEEQASLNESFGLMPEGNGLENRLFVPAPFKESQSSFNYLSQNVFDDENPTEASCTGSVTQLFDQKKKISKNMQDEMIKADLVEYITMINGNIFSFYTDRKNAEQLGCYYGNKILHNSAVGSISKIDKLSGAKSAPKAISPQEVQDLFQKALNMKDLPFAYVEDGCYARAHLMARRFEEMGYKVEKAWVRGKIGAPGLDGFWDYHVAPAFDIKEADGRIVKYVIDPSLMNKAVPLDEWTGKMSFELKGPVVKTTYPFPSNTANFQRTTVAISSSDPYFPTDNGFSEEEKMSISKEKMVEYSLKVKQ